MESLTPFRGICENYICLLTLIATTLNKNKFKLFTIIYLIKLKLAPPKHLSFNFNLFMNQKLNMIKILLDVNDYDR